MGRSDRISGVVVLSVLFVSAAAWGATDHEPAARPSAIRDAVLPRPQRLAKRVEFWSKIFTRYAAHDVVVHDTKYLDKIYTVLDLEGASDKEKSAATTAEKARIQALLLRVGEQASDPDKLRGSERTIYELFKDVDEPDKFKAAAKRVRAQVGLRERFVEGIRVSRRHLPDMERIFRNAGLPIELTRLPLIESCFDLTAYSWRGAAGIWQFMPQTGRLHGLLVHRLVDERRDPLRATAAAAKYLAAAYEQLGNWPLAITAYNHGVKGIARGVETVGSTDVADLVEHYDGPAFGFAGQNFYAEFLAALDVDREPEQHFGPLVYEEPVGSEEVSLPYAMRIESAAKGAGVSRMTLAQYNPALASGVIRGSSSIPRGYRLRLPAGTKTAFERHVAALATQRRAEVAEVAAHRVRSGETLSVIAKRYGTTIMALRRANGIRNPHVVHVGQLIKVSSPAGPGRLSAEARYIRHRVRRGQTLSHIARQYGTSVGVLQRHNGIRNPRRLRAGQVINVPSG